MLVIKVSIGNDNVFNI